jgi:nucleotide-binding universal stress UspA family protein
VRLQQNDQVDETAENAMNCASGSPNLYVGNIPAAGAPVRVLVAIDVPEDSNSDHNERNVRHAALLSKRAGGELHVVSVYSTSARGAPPCRVERYLPALRVKVRDRRRCAIRQLLRRLKIADAFIHVEEGDSRQVIGALASSLNAVVVDGARTGMEGSPVPIDAGRLHEDVAA